MPDKPMTVAAYAAGASLAAITLVYVFAPTFFLDEDPSRMTADSRSSGTMDIDDLARGSIAGITDAGGSRRRSSSNSTFYGSKKRGSGAGGGGVVVGLHNPANLCFINSVLQALAGLGDLRVYLIRELHRRRLRDESGIIEEEKDEDNRHCNSITVSDSENGCGTSQATREKDTRKLTGLRNGILTKALKVILDQLNERPLHRKTVSARAFIIQLELALSTRLSTSQQDAQEFFQIVAERLCDEYHARMKWDRELKKKSRKAVLADDPEASINHETLPTASNKRSPTNSTDDDEAHHEAVPNAFPLEGALESEIECQTCHFKPRKNKTSFVNLTLNVPQKSSTSLDICLDGLLKSERISDFKCDQCRLEHALHDKQQRLQKLQQSKGDQASTTLASTLQHEINLIQTALRTDPENPSAEANLPNVTLAPKRIIDKSVRISTFPKILAIHLSRSIFDPATSLVKNMAKVSFPETLSLGGLLNRHKYRLLALVAHQGSHNSGHYETFRRQVVYPMYSTPNSLRRAESAAAKGASGVESSRAPSDIPQVTQALDEAEDALSTPNTIAGQSQAPQQASPIDSMTVESERSSTVPDSPSSTGASTAPDSTTRDSKSAASASTAPTSLSTPPSPPTPTFSGARARLSKTLSRDSISLPRFHRSSRGGDRWWRMSDDKIRECKTADVMAMQKEVYLLFYELLEG